MTEEEWLTSTNPRRMVRHVSPERHERASRFFACHCCRIVGEVIVDERSRHAVTAAELVLVGFTPRRRYADALDGARVAHMEAASRSAPPARVIGAHLAHRAARDGCYPGMLAHIRDALASSGLALERRERRTLAAWFCEVLRDTVGNPFRPADIDASWISGTAFTLARQMCREEEFSAMPILADALQDAGCDNDEVLDHCRGPGPHVRGCWVVDQVLAKG